MPVISLASPKGGAGKTTTALILATQLSENGATVTINDLCAIKKASANE